MRKAIVVLLLFALGFGGAYLLVSPRAQARSLVAGKLTGSVGSPTTADSFTIGLSAGTVPAGTYELDVTDYADIHDFHFCNEGATATTCAPGAAVNEATSVSGTGSVAWTVTLAPGTYVYFCDLHSSMHGVLVVTAGSTSTTTTTTATTTTTTTTPTTTRAGSPLSVRIVSVHATRTLVQVTVAANELARATAVLTTRNGRWVARAAGDGKRLTLALKPARALRPGIYAVKVTVTCCGASATARKTIRIV